jgi:capsular exopolysaccharide synthesis family protein
VIFVVVLALASAGFFSYRQTPMYRASATVLVKPLNPSQIFQSSSFSFVGSMETEQALATSPDVAGLAAAEAAAAGVTSPDSGSVSTSVPPDTTFLEVAYAAPDALQAQSWAQAYALGYMEYRRQQALAQYNSAVQGYSDQADKVQGELDANRAALAAAPPAEKTGLDAAIKTEQQTLLVLARQAAEVPFPVTDTAAQMIAPATLPSRPYAPSWSRNLALALFAGLALGLGVAFIRERLDDRMTGRDDLEEAAGAPVLAIVPQTPGWRKRQKTKLVARDQPKSASAEAYRTIRTNFGFLAKTSGLSVVSIASAGTGEGKTTTTANLAVSLAQTGKRVIAMSCDLRKPRLHHFFDLTNDNGVTSILVDGLTVPQVAQRIPGLDALRIIASGPVPHNPAELLGSDEMEELLRELRHYADFVLVDTAPVLAVSDSLILAPKTDGVVIVTDASATHRSAVQSTRDQLEQVGANIVGAIFNNFDPSRAKSYPGYYRYSYYGASPYRDGDKAPKAKRAQAEIDPAAFWR